VFEQFGDLLETTSLFGHAKYNDKYLLFIKDAQHVDFTSYAVIGEKQPVLAYWGPASGSSKGRYQLICTYALHFFKAYIEQDKESFDFLQEKPENNFPNTPVKIFRKKGVPGPPTLDAFVNRIFLDGIESAVQWMESFQAEFPEANLFKENTLNQLGYKFLYFWGNSKSALEIFKLNALLHSRSANVFDSLGEAYLQTGDTEMAIQNYEKSLKIDPNNTNAIQILNRIKTEN
jgi:tetratricopeptide (TPR) repeat protein